MRVAYKGSYIEFVIFMGVTESYPRWFEKMLEESIYTDDSNYTFYVDKNERRHDYYEKSLIADYSVFLRKPDGETFLTDYDIFSDLYETFRYSAFTNSGIAAFQEDCIEYVECKGGTLPSGYPAWFYEHFTEAINFPPDDETIYFYDEEKHVLTAAFDSLEVTIGGEITVTDHCVFLRNKKGEIKGMSYEKFLKFYDPEPKLGGTKHDR